MVMKVVAKNRRARHDYEILDTIEAGIILAGHEVKSCRDGQVNLSGAYVSFLDDKPLLKNMHIAPYRHASGLEGYEPEHDRTLLLKKNEMARLQVATQQKGVTIIPLEVRVDKFVKVILGTGRGRKKYDKREKIKEREITRRLRRQT